MMIATAKKPGTNTGHGHVWKRPDGMLARCGGPAICQECCDDALMWGDGSPAPAGVIHAKAGKPHKAPAQIANPPAPPKTTFKCDTCGGVFPSTPEDEAAAAKEAAELFPGEENTPENMATLCDDCFAKVDPRTHPEQYANYQAEIQRGNDGQA